MFKKTIFSILTVALIMISPTISAQMCGDANSDTTINIQDLIYIIEYLRDVPTSPPINLANADCDGITGVTIGDAVSVSNHMFHLEPINCNVSGSYTYPPSLVDTVFFPRMLGVPDAINHVSLPVITVFQDSVQGVYLPFLHQGSGASGNFAYSDTYLGQDAVLVDGDLTADTTILMGIDIYNGQFSGTHEYFTLLYDRTSAGIGDVIPEPTDRTALWQIAIEKDGELYRPVIEYYDVPLPADTLYFTPTEIIANVNASEPFPDTFLVDFTSGPLPVNFNLTPSDSWIVLVDFPPEGLTTPASVEVTFNSFALGAGTYTGTIDVINTDPDAILPVDHVDITLTINPPVGYPWGDLNCDGETNVVDLSLLVDYLFKGAPPHAPCP
jgi:hypothetical protein